MLATAINAGTSSPMVLTTLMRDLPPYWARGTVASAQRGDHAHQTRGPPDAACGHHRRQLMVPSGTHRAAQPLTVAEVIEAAKQPSGEPMVCLAGLSLEIGQWHITW